MFSLVLICFFFAGRIAQKTTQPVCRKLSGKVSHGPQKKASDFDDNSDRIKLGLAMVRVTVGLGTAILRRGRVTGSLFKS